MPSLLIAGGGVGALSAALVVRRAGWSVQLFEQAQAFSEVGAGLQLGPNATRLLQAWGLGSALEAVAAFPDAVVARRISDGRELGRLPLGAQAVQRYGAPYATLHRRDLHGLLLEGLQELEGVELQLGCKVLAFEESAERVSLIGERGCLAEGHGLIGADGLWSRVREFLLQDQRAQPTGHLAYRALIPRADLPRLFQSNVVTVWLGPHQHAVTYPIRGGDALNLVLIVRGQSPPFLQTWDDVVLVDEARRAVWQSCSALQDCVAAAPAWGRWSLCDRPPVDSPSEMARGRVALLGDAAHPMRPFLAQGAAMSIEDAAELGRVLKDLRSPGTDLPSALSVYAQQRWQRVAQVQARSRRNGKIFHAVGPIRRARDLALRFAGSRLMDLPWLYGYGQSSVTRP